MEEFSYRYYREEQLKISSIDSQLSKEEKRVRRYLMNYIIDHGQAFHMNDLSIIAEDIDIPKKKIANILNCLHKKNGIVSDENGDINFIYPVSALPTNHRIKLMDKRKFSAMCAIDAMGAAFTFKQDVDIISKCGNCGSDIQVSIKSGNIHKYKPSDLHILHVDLNRNSNWSGNC